jgi:hypothetical protein
MCLLACLRDGVTGCVCVCVCCVCAQQTEKKEEETTAATDYIKQFRPRRRRRQSEGLKDQFGGASERQMEKVAE